MKKKMRMLAATLLLCFGLSACGQAPAPSEEAPEAVSNALSASIGQIAFVATEAQQESGQGQAVLQAIKQFSGETGTSFTAYKSVEEENGATLDLAVNSGAGLVVLLGYEGAELLARGQRDYPNVQFVLVEGTEPKALQKNSAVIQLAYEQAGWLAGYAAVKNGATSVAVMDAEDMATRRSALGFALGADAAAQEKQIRPRLQVLQVKLEDDATSLRAKLNQIYQNGAEVLFVNIPQWQALATSAATSAKCQTFGMNADGAEQGESFLASVTAGIGQALLHVLQLWQQGMFPGGEVLASGVEDGGVFLQMDQARFDAFDLADYDGAVAQLQDNIAILEQVVVPDEEGYWPTMEMLQLHHLQLSMSDGPSVQVSTPESMPAIIRK